MRASFVFKEVLALRFRKETYQQLHEPPTRPTSAYKDVHSLPRDVVWSALGIATHRPKGLLSL